MTRRVAAGAPARLPRTPRSEPWRRRHLLGLEDLSPGEILSILERAESFRRGPGGGLRRGTGLRGRVVCICFFEPSTRTSNSFALAAKRLSADVMTVNVAASSVHKGETLADTARNLEAMGVDIVVLRHPAPGAPHLLSGRLKASVVNAGDGAHEHPTQALLDILTIRDCFGTLRGLRVAIVGDIAHSRVARSSIWGLTKLGVRVTVVGPATLVPRGIEALGVEVCHDLDRVLETCDVFSFLRIQLERQSATAFPSIREYARLYGMNAERAERMKPEAIVMHPGPVNRGVEITPDVADGPRSVILRQVTNGLAVRMAVLSLVSSAGAAGGGPCR